MSKVGIIDCVKMVNGAKLMHNNKNLTSVKCPFPALEIGAQMFNGCSSLINVSIPDLSSLQNGYAMFYRTSVQNFTCDLPSLKYADAMFMNYNTDVSHEFDKTANLISFSGNLGELVDGSRLFCQQSKFTTFYTSSMKNLKSGDKMFYRTYLNLNSIKQIADNIGDISKLNRDNDSDWTYQVNDETKVIEKSKRGVITINGWFPVRTEDSINVQKELDKITAKGWYVNRQAGGITTYAIDFYNEKTHNVVIQKFTNNEWKDVLNTDVKFMTNRSQGHTNKAGVVTWDTEGLGTDLLKFTLYSAGRPDVGYIEDDTKRDKYEYWKDDGTCSGENAIILLMVYSESKNSGVQVDFYIETQKASGMTVEARRILLHNTSFKYRLLIDGNVILTSA